MVLNDIEKLLDKYEEGLTSLKEEQKLRDYFLGANVPPHLEHYKVIFGYYIAEEKTSYNNPIELPEKQSINYGWLAVAATVVLAIGFYFKKPSKETLGTYSNPEMAYKEFKSSMQFLSTNFKKGTSKVTYLKGINQVGMQVGYLEEIENTTRLIFKTK